MTLDEAQAVAAIASTADNGCEVCVNHLREQLQARFPEFIWAYVDNPEPDLPDDEVDDFEPPRLDKVIQASPAPHIEGLIN